MAGTRAHYRQQLSRDGSTLRTLADRLVRVLADIRHEAAQAQDAATAEALVATSQSLADTLGTDWAAVVDAHERACDEVDMAPAYAPDIETHVAFHMAQTPEPALTVDEVAARFAVRQAAE